MKLVIINLIFWIFIGAMLMISLYEYKQALESAKTMKEICVSCR